MSDVQRFEWCLNETWGVWPQPAGRYVRYDDYKNLELEVRALRINRDSAASKLSSLENQLSMKQDDWLAQCKENDALMYRLEESAKRAEVWAGKLTATESRLDAVRMALNVNAYLQLERLWKEVDAALRGDVEDAHQSP